MVIVFTSWRIPLNILFRYAWQLDLRENSTSKQKACLQGNGEEPGVCFVPAGVKTPLAIAREKNGGGYNLLGFRFSQRCCGGFRSAETWRCVTGYCPTFRRCCAAHTSVDRNPQHVSLDASFTGECCFGFRKVGSISATRTRSIFLFPTYVLLQC